MVACLGKGDSKDEITLLAITMHSVGKATYEVGDALDVANTKITLHYSDAETKQEDVQSDWVTGAGLDNDKVFTTAGMQILTVTYEGMWTNFNVIVGDDDEGPGDVTLRSITMLSVGRVVYDISDTLDVSGTGIILHYSDGTTEEKDIEITWVTGAGLDSDKVFITAGAHVLTVTYEGKTANFTVLVNEDPNAVTLSSLTMLSVGRVVYAEGDTLDVAGTKITLHYSDGTTENKDVLGAWITGVCLNSSKIFTATGIHVLTVTYEGKATNFSVVVEEGIPPVVVPNGTYTIVTFEMGCFIIDFTDTDAMLTLIGCVLDIAATAKAKWVPKIEAMFEEAKAPLVLDVEEISKIAGKWAVGPFALELTVDLVHHFYDYDTDKKDWNFTNDGMEEFLYEYFIDNNLWTIAALEAMDVTELAEAIRTQFEIDESTKSLESAISYAIEHHMPSESQEALINGQNRVILDAATKVLEEFEKAETEFWEQANKILKFIPDEPDADDAVWFLGLIDWLRLGFLAIDVTNNDTITFADESFAFTYDDEVFVISDFDFPFAVDFDGEKFIVTIDDIVLTFVAE